MKKIPASEQPTYVVDVRETTADSRPQSKRHMSPLRWGILAALVGVSCLALTAFSVTILDVLFGILPADEVVFEVVERPEPVTVAATRGEAVSQIEMSPIFTPEIQFWKPLIAEWALAWQIDPNLIATVIQIESCGDPFVSSGAGAQGLFQVMPFHFDQGEDMLNIQNNARRGLNYLNLGLDYSEGHAGLALAGYNGGHSVIWRGSAAWYHETQRYYYWGAGIYEDASAGLTTSPRLEEWLAAGGASLCARASQSQANYEIQTID